MNEIPNAIVRFFAGTSVAEFLGALSLIGIASAALIQAVKEVVPVRRWFQKRRLCRWLHTRCRALGADEVRRPLLRYAPAATFPPGGRPPNQGSNDPLLAAAWTSLLALTVDGDECALLDLPVEEMAAHMNAAMRAAVENPRPHAVLLLLSAQQSDPEDLELVLSRGRRRNVASPKQHPLSDLKIVALAEARSRVMYQMQRAVAGFELATGYGWKYLLQITTFLVGAALTGVALAGPGNSGLDSVGSFIGVLFSAVVAGFLAPVARDLTVVLKRLRDGRV